MGTDYNEIICTAIDTIISARLEGLQYDVTKVCMIEDDSNRNNGKYVVSDGAVRFEAFSEDNSFRKGNSVQVVIPNNDYTMQKTIIGRIATTDTTPFKYTSPMDTMVKITSSTFNTANQVSLLANDETVIDDKTYIGTKVLVQKIKEPAKFSGFTRLGITADFQAWLFNQNAVEGTYGLQILLHLSNGNKVELIFSNKDMYGNPYNFESFFSQEKVFDISNYKNIDEIEINFFQLGDFTDGTNKINYREEALIEGELGEKLPDNLFVDNVLVYLGYDISDFNEETLRLYCLDSTDFKYGTDTETMTRNIGLRWIHKISDDEFEILNEQHFVDGEFTAIWYKYDKDFNERDDYAGLNWKEIFRTDNENASLTYLVNLSPKEQKEEFKVIGIQKSKIENEATTIPDTVYSSNLLTFENQNYVPDRKSVEAATALQIVCEDGSEGNYFVYNQNGKINTPGTGQGYQRQFKAMYKGAEINGSFNGHSIDYIKWWLPANKTMLKYSSGWHSNTKENDYYIVERKPDVGEDGKQDLNVYQSYSIGDQWYNTLSNNTIKCVLSVDGIEYEALEQLNFGKAGSNGTNLTLVLQFEDNQNALIAGNGNTLTVSAELFDASGSNLGFVNDELDKISWSWFKKSETEYISLPNSPIGSSVQITCGTNSVPDDNYYILQCTFNPVNGQKLVSYLPIPIKANGYAHIEGATEVIYNHQGTPSYYSDAYVLYQLTGQEGNKVEYEEVECNWSLKQDDIEVSNGYLPQLKLIKNNKYGLMASPFYLSDYNDKVCVCAKNKNDNTILWSQPILIMQSQYDFAMLNEWDGSLTLDEENGTIMSAMLGAGRKNKDNNTFSGVLIGDLKASGQDSTSAQTGVYGLHEGVMSYALKEDGTATFGKAGKGQIKIDGNTGVIKSGNYDNGTGMKIDLDNGILNIQDNKISRINIQPEGDKPYLNIQSTDYKTLINIGSNDYYLQSNNYTVGEQGKISLGTKFDLAKGSLLSKSSGGSVLISSDGDPYFQISNSADVDLINFSQNNQFLQSSEYVGIVHKKTSDGYYLYLDGSDTVAVSSNGQTIYTTVNNEKAGENNTGTVSGNPKSFSSQTEKITVWDTDGVETEKTVTISAEAVKNKYLAELKPKLFSTTGKGLKIDLSTGRIDGYNLALTGINGKNRIVFDSSSSTSPFYIIGDESKTTFSIGWNGTLTCNKINYLGTQPPTGNQIININDNFVVNKNGSGSAPGMSVGYAGSCGKAGRAANADYATRAGEALSATSAKGANQAASLFNQYGNYYPSASSITVLTGESSRKTNMAGAITDIQFSTKTIYYLTR